MLSVYRLTFFFENILILFLVFHYHIRTILCGSLGSYLAENDGWRTPFFWIGISFFAWSYIVYLIVTRETKRPHKLHLILPRILTNSYFINKNVTISRELKSENCIKILDVQEKMTVSLIK